MAILETALDEARTRRSLPEPPARRRIRESAGVTQVAVALTLGVHRACVSRWEAGFRTPRGTLLHAYAALLRELEEATIDVLPDENDPAGRPGHITKAVRGGRHDTG